MAKTYLPKRPSRLKALLRNPIALWLVLIAMFFAIWQLLGTQSGSEPGHARTDNGGFPFQSVIIFAVVFIGFMGWMRWLRRRLRTFNAESAEVLKLFTAADFTTAATRFEDLSRRYRYPKQVRATATYNLAMALLRSGSLERARAILEALDPTLARSAPGLRRLAAAQLAVLHALGGDTEASERWNDEAQARLKQATSTGTALPSGIEGATVFARAVTALRADRFADASRELATEWPHLEGTLIATELRSFRALRLFADAEGDAARAKVAGATAALADVRPGELTWMGIEWPAMRAFLDAVLVAPSS